MTTRMDISLKSDADDVMEFVSVTNTEELTPETSKRLLRKIDLYLLPVLCFLYAFQYMDKLSASYAATLGLKKDLKMVNQEFSWTATSLSLGMLIFEFPAVLLLQRFPVAKTVSFFIISWGLVLCLHSVAETYTVFIVLRVMAGCLEAAVTPAVTLITSQWYRKDEQFLRVAIWFSFHGIGLILGDAISYGLAVHAKSYTIHAWRVLFIVAGGLTILIGILILFHVPDNPSKAWFLNECEKKLVVERIRVNQQGFGNKKFKMYQFKEAITDYKTWLFFLFPIANLIPNSGINNFGTTLLTNDLRYSRQNALLLQMISGGIEIVGCIFIASCSKYFKSRIMLTFGTISFTMIFMCFLAFGHSTKLKLTGFVMTTLLPLGLICMLSLVASNVAGHTKKVTVSAIFLIGHSLGYIIGPQIYLSYQAPNYVGAKIGMVVCAGASLLILAATYVAYSYENKKKESLDTSEEPIKDFEFADLTDKENPKFRYSI